MPQIQVFVPRAISALNSHKLPLDSSHSLAFSVSYLYSSCCFFPRSYRAAFILFLNCIKDIVSALLTSSILLCSYCAVFLCCLALKSRGTFSHLGRSFVFLDIMKEAKENMVCGRLLKL